MEFLNLAKSLIIQKKLEDLFNLQYFLAIITKIEKSGR